MVIGEIMTIHVVQKGDTINSIADKYGVSVDRLILENGLIPPIKFAVGETIVILRPKIIYMIKDGDTLESIAAKNNVTIFQILRNNPYLSDREYIYPGETIVISYEGEKIRSIAINSYAYPFIDINILKKTLPFLTYLTIYSYEVTAEGEINDIDDTEIIETAKAYGVAPVMMLIASSNNIEEEVAVMHSILSSKEAQVKLVNNILRILKTKGYSGVSFTPPYLQPIDRSIYEELVLKFIDIISKEGYKVYDTLAVRLFLLLTGTLTTGIDYLKIGQKVDGSTLISYTFGFSEGIPPGTTSMATYRRFIESSTKLMPPEKIYNGVPVIGYIWNFPFIPNKSKGMAVTYDSAIQIAIENNAEILYDEITNCAYFKYISFDESIVRFWDARSIDVFVKIVPEFGLMGISIWNIMNWFPQMWLVINSQYDIDKVL